MKDIVTPVSHEEVRSMIKESLGNAALLNYTRLSGETKVEGELLHSGILRAVCQLFIIILDITENDSHI